MRQWLPAHMQRRFQRLIRLASCGAGGGIKRARVTAAGAVYGPTLQVLSMSPVGPALVALTVEGVTAAAPGESAEQAGIGLRAGFQRLFPEKDFTAGMDKLIPTDLRD